MKKNIGLSILAGISVSILATLTAQAQISTLRITEVMSSSGTGGTADWFEVTNYGLSDVSITGWKMDDNSFSSGNSVALSGVSSISSGQSVIFLESATAETASTFRTFWGSNVTSITIGSYTGSGVSFGSGGDGVVLFDSTGVEMTPRVTFGAATTGSSFYYSHDSTGSPSTSPNANAILSTASLSNGQNTYTSSFNTGSPGTAMNAVPEPQTYVLLGIGAAFLLWRVRRRA
jgi:predicted extracellular nuclease